MGPKIKQTLALFIIFLASFSLFFVLFGGKAKLKVWLQSRNGQTAELTTNSSPITPNSNPATTENTATNTVPNTTAEATPETTSTPNSPSNNETIAENNPNIAITENTETITNSVTTEVLTTENTPLTETTEITETAETTNPTDIPANSESVPTTNNVANAPSANTETVETTPVIMGQLPYTDVPTNNIFYNDIFFLYDTGIINENTSSLFNPKSTISRDDADRAILAVSTCYACLKPATNQSSWLKMCENTTKINRAEEFINKKEAITLLLKQLGTELKIMPKNYFTDVDVNDWAKDYLYTATQLGLIKINKDNKILPNDYLTKDEFAGIIKKTTDLKQCANVKQVINDYLEKKKNLPTMDQLFMGNN